VAFLSYQNVVDLIHLATRVHLAQAYQEYVAICSSEDHTLDELPLMFSRWLEDESGERLKGACFWLQGFCPSPTFEIDLWLTGSSRLYHNCWSHSRGD